LSGKGRSEATRLKKREQQHGFALMWKAKVFNGGNTLKKGWWTRDVVRGRKSRTWGTMSESNPMGKTLSKKKTDPSEVGSGKQKTENQENGTVPDAWENPNREEESLGTRGFRGGYSRGKKGGHGKL